MAEQVEVPLLRGLIGRALRRRRLAQQRTLRDVAAAALVSMPYLSEIERGRKEASSEILAAICRALGVRLTDLLDEVRLELARVEPEIAPAVPAAPQAGLGAPVTAHRGLDTPVRGLRGLGVPTPTGTSRPFEPRAAAAGPLRVGGRLVESGWHGTGGWLVEGGWHGAGGWFAVDAAAACDGEDSVTPVVLDAPLHQHGVSPNLGGSAVFEAVLGAG
ncbi:helix-turn-helix transcriptional regulator, partial [Frankia sp. AiPs1]|uniref:helix-turn-helix domain-containing protein n=1 Tax=Frankia sp. AiPs1 TaxID=573493 RepID=UPI002043BC8E